jgi:predicted nicotinamide N-methyase
MISDPRAFILTNTRLQSPPHTPELRLHLADEITPIWRLTEERLAEIGLPPPFWAFAWAGGQALARYVLDNPDCVAGKHVLDFASGSGLVAIAAMKAGAAHVLAADIDPFALAAIALNAAANNVAIEPSATNWLEATPPTVDVILAGDIFYQRDIAEKVLPFLAAAVGRGVDVLVGDPGRAYLPRERLVARATYEVPVSRELEDFEIKRTSVWALRP